jgi:hypothetical protein
MTQSILRVGVSYLSERETTLLRGLIKLNAHTEHGAGWEFVESAPYDLMFIDESQADASIVANLKLTTPVVSVLNAQSTELPNSLLRPFASEALMSWLKRARKHAETKPAPAPVAKPALESTLPGAFLSTRFKLIKWPPALVLGGDPARIRMATMLSKQSLHMKELAMIAQQPLELVHTFLVALHQTGLLVIGQPTYAITSPSVGSNQVAVVNKQEKTSLLGLMGLLRKKLGLG